MEYIYIGDVVNTHGIKGEIRIISDFKYKNKVFIKGMNLYVGRTKEKLTINTYRPHKIYDMVTLDGINDINDVIGYKGDQVFINKSDIEIDGILDEDLIDMEVYGDNKYIGKVTSILKGVKCDNLVVGSNRHLIPNIPEFIKNIDKEKRRIDINIIEGLLNED